MSVKNILILIHGMSPSGMYQDDRDITYNRFLDRILENQNLKESFPDNSIIKVFWGHNPTVNRDLPEDQMLTKAEHFLCNQVGYECIEKDNSSNNKLLTPSSSILRDGGIDFTATQAINRFIHLDKIKEEIIIRGLGDVVYYCSKDGEEFVRKTVYDQILRGIFNIINEEGHNNIFRLHFFSHSAGVTVMHDFLYGLFNNEKESDSITDKQISEETSDQYLELRELRKGNKLKLGSISAAASQLPILLLRKQELVRRFFIGDKTNLVNPEDIGIEQNSQKIKCKFFYDRQDILGFPSKNLYSNNNSIMDIEVNTSWHPSDAHTLYWYNPTVIEETINLIRENLN